MGRWEERKKAAFYPCPQAYKYRENNWFYFLNICYWPYNSFQDRVCLHFTDEETGYDDIFFKVQWEHVSGSYCYITNHPKTRWLKTINIYYCSQVSESAMCFIWSWLDSFMCLQSHVGWVIPLVAQTVKHLPTIWETRVQSMGWEDLLEKEMATHCGILAWKIP